MQQLEIVNLALARLGQPSISAMSEASNEAARVSAVWDNALLATQHAFRWPFLMTRVGLALVEETPDSFPYLYEYALPSDMVQAYEIVSGIPDVHVPFLIEGSYLYTDKEDAVLVYSFKETRCSKFSPTFCDALAWRIAGDLSLSLSGSTQYAQTAEQNYQQCLSMAKAQAANSDLPKRARISRYVKARR